MLEPTVSGKLCLRCGETKPAVDFTRDSRKKTGLGPRCKVCVWGVGIVILWEVYGQGTGATAAMRFT